MWATFLAAMAGPLALRVLSAVGFGVITVVGFASVKQTVSSAVVTALGGLSGSVYQILALAGFVDAVGIWLGAITTILSFMVLKKLALLS